MEKKEQEKSLITVLSLNVKGQLAKISQFCSDNNLNILRIVSSAANKDDTIQKIVMYVEGNREFVDSTCKKIEEIDGILKVVNFKTNEGYIEKELCMIKVFSSNEKLPEIMNLVTDSNGKTIFVTSEIMIFEIEDNEENVNNFVNNLSEITPKVEITRSGMIAMTTNDYVDELIDIKLQIK